MDNKKEKIKVSVMLPKETHEMLIEESDRHDISISKYVEKAVNFYKLMKDAEKNARDKGMVLI